jgi:selenocysteine lyase/cysteine desulfurase
MKTVTEASQLWSPATTYLDTASYGLPPRPGWDALQAALEDWRGGRTSWERWGDATEVARAEFARMVSVPVERVAIGGNVSAFAGLVAASLPDGTRVTCPEIEFTSNIWPFLAQEPRGVSVRAVPAVGLAEAIDADTDVVAFSAVQSATGEVADLEAIAAAAAEHGVMTVVDASQACGWLPIDAGAFDFVTCVGYKWLVSPRGTAFMSVRPERLAAVSPHAAGWYAGEDPQQSYFGPPLRLAESARRLDVSPAWFSWVGTAPALKLLNEVGVEAIHEHDVGLANAFREGLGLEPSNSAIVSVGVPGAEERLSSAGVMASVRGGQLRTAWHIYNTDEDVARVLQALRA